MRRAHPRHCLFSPRRTGRRPIGVFVPDWELYSRSNSVRAIQRRLLRNSTIVTFSRDPIPVRFTSIPDPVGEAGHPLCSGRIQRAFDRRYVLHVSVLRVAATNALLPRRPGGLTVLLGCMRVDEKVVVGGPGRRLRLVVLVGSRWVLNGRAGCVLC